MEQVSLEAGMTDRQVIEDERVDNKDDELACAIKGESITEIEPLQYNSTYASPETLG